MLDSVQYLKTYQWQEGEALQKGGIKKPILVKHKKDKKGIGHQVNGSADAWWERLFDGQLKSLDVSQGDGGGVSFKQEQAVVASAVPIHESPLYRMFVRGETLQGTVNKVTVVGVKSKDSGSKDKKDKSKDKKDKKKKSTDRIEKKSKDKKRDKKEKKKSKEEKEKKEKKEKREKKNKKEKLKSKTHKA